LHAEADLLGLLADSRDLAAQTCEAIAAGLDEQEVPWRSAPTVGLPSPMQRSRHATACELPMRHEARNHARPRIGAGHRKCSKKNESHMEFLLVKLASVAA
jgi:hypothetical protein